MKRCLLLSISLLACQPEASSISPSTDAEPDVQRAEDQPPTLRFLSPRAELSGAVQVILEAQDDHGIQRVVLSLNGEQVAEWSEAPFEWSWAEPAAGLHRLEAMAEDSAAQVSRVEREFRWIEPCPPEGCPPELLALPERLCGDLLLEMDSAGEAELRFEVDGRPLGSLPGLPHLAIWSISPGPHQLSLIAVDAQGERRTELRLEGVAGCGPVPSLRLSPELRFLTAAQELSVNLSGEAPRLRAFLDALPYQEDDEPPLSLFLQPEEISPGPHQLLLLGEAGGQAVAHLLNFELDLEPPIIQLLEPGAEAGPQHGHLSVRVQLSPDAARLEVQLGSLEQRREQPPWELGFELASLSSGFQTLHIQAWDRAGLRGELSRELLIDRPPSLRFLEHPQVLRGTSLIRVDAQDDLGLARVSLEVDGRALGNFDPLGSFEWTPEYRRGLRQLKAQALDNAGQEAEASLILDVDHPLEMELMLCNPECSPLQEREIFGSLQLKAEIRDDDEPPALVLLSLPDQQHRLRDPYDFFFETEEWPDGPLSLQLSTSDPQGQVLERRWEFQINNCDRDHDGHQRLSCGGGDCQDENPLINPGQPDLLVDGEDQNCDGHDGSEPDAAPPPDVGLDAGLPDLELLPDSSLSDAAPGSLAPQGPWGPAGRLDELSFAESPEAAREMGCEVLGRNAGTSLQSWFRVLQVPGFAPYLEPNAEGGSVIFVFLEARGWPPLAPVDHGQLIDLQSLSAERRQRRSLIIPESLVGEFEAQVHFPNTQVDAEGHFRTTPERFVFPFPVGRVEEALVVDVLLEQSFIEGDLRPDGPGIALEAGRLEGYWREEGVLEWLRAFHATCQAPEHPRICDNFAINMVFRNGPEAALPLIRDLFEMGNGDDGFDVTWNGGAPRACELGAPDCDTIGICVQLHSRGEVIHGRSDDPESPCLHICDPLADCLSLPDPPPCAGLARRDWLLAQTRCLEGCDPEWAESLGELTCPALLEEARAYIPFFAQRCP